MTRSDEPAWGERNAATGYYPQYQISAALVIGGLREDSLRWIALADPQAGRVDDFQIATDQRVDAYQFKWSGYGGPITFNDLISASGAAPSLIQQLADGWRRLTAAYPHQRVIVHLVTNEYPSVADRLPVGHPPPQPKHFAAFIEQVWKPAHAAAAPECIVVPPAWAVAWEQVRDAGGLDEADFRVFVRDCQLEFGYALPSTDGMSRRDAGLYEQEIREVTERIFQTVSDPQQIIRLDRESLLRRLGWQDRFEFRNRHTFPVNEALYQPIKESSEALVRALALDGGYLAVLGPPGSGKSTLLTQHLRYLPERVIRYYAYIPDGQGPAIRGEAVNFLHDITRAIDNAGFRSGQSVRAPEREQLRERLREQLQMLHRDWQETGRKTIILVDGLDHISREQRPTHSLLRDLPLPQEVPPGVFFVLGSQTDKLDDLPTGVQSAIRQPARRITMASLNRESVRRVIEKADLGDLLTEAFLDRIVELSGGHPLALMYLLQALKAAADESDIAQLFDETRPYDGAIEEQYNSYWRQIEADDELAYLLGLVARIRGAIDLNWIGASSSPAAVRRLERVFAHLFRREGPRRWYFFHNSFRLYLSERTARDGVGSFDTDKDRALHYKLATMCRQSEYPGRQSDEVYHLFKAGADEELLRRASQEYFREQFLNLRPVEAIREDIVSAIQVAGRRSDVVALARLLLCAGEMSRRENNTERLRVADLLISMGETQAALEQLCDGHRRRVTAQHALESAIELFKCGMEKEAGHVFDIAEPLEYLSGAQKVDRHYQHRDQFPLESWAAAAVHFRPVDRICASILSLQVESDPFAHGARVGEGGASDLSQDEQGDNRLESHGGDETRELQCLLLFRTGSALIKEGRWDDVRRIERELLLQGLAGEEFSFWLRAHSWRACFENGNITLAQQLLSEAIAPLDPGSTRKDRGLIIANGLLRIAEDKEGARLWLPDASLLPLQKPPDFNSSFFDRVSHHAQMLYALGEQRQPAELIPEPSDAGQMASIYFQRGICTMARIWAQARLGQALDTGTIRLEVYSLLHLFDRPFKGPDWHQWAPLRRIKGEFYQLLVDAVGRHGIEAVSALAEEFATAWENNGRYWSSEAVREIVLALHAVGAKAGWVTEQLERVEQKYAGDELHSRIAEHIKQAGAWVTIGKADKAKASLRQALLDSSSVGDKDYQLNAWIDWMACANRFAPADAPRRIAWFAQTVVWLARNGGPYQEAAYKLLEAAFEWSPRRGIKMFHWLSDRGLINFDRAVRTLLRAALVSSAIPSRLVAAIVLDLSSRTSDVDGKLIGALINRLLARLGRSSTVDYARALVSAIDIHSLRSRRRAWRRSLASALKESGIQISDVGLSEDDLRQDEDQEIVRPLRLKDGSTLTSDEVLAKAATLEGFGELMEQEDDQYFSWQSVTMTMIPKLESPREVLAVAGLFDNCEYSASILIQLAERLLELGDRENAKRIAQAALTESEIGGWDLDSSGGIKIRAFKVLLAIDTEPARQQAFSQLVEDVASGAAYPEKLVQGLDKILSLLTSSVPEVEVWNEIESYVRSLFHAVDSEDLDAGLLETLKTDLDDDTATRALADLLSGWATQPVVVLANSAHFALLRLLREGDEAARKMIQRMFRGNDRERECALMMVDAAGINDDAFITGFEEELRGLADSPDYAIRLVVRRLGRRIGIPVPDGRSGLEAARSLYRLLLPTGDDESHELDGIEYDALPDTEDPYELLKILLDELSFIAVLADLPKQNVIQRAGQIALALGQEDKWARLGEKKMRDRLESIDLNYVYHRPRAIIARRAYFRLIAELADEGRLREQAIRQIELGLDFYDPDTLAIKPVARPEFISAMPKPMPERIPGASATKAPRDGEVDVPLLRTSDGLIIFGECTEIKRLEWETPTVIRQSKISATGPGDTATHHSFFRRERSCSVRTYPDHEVNQQPPPLIIQRGERIFDSPDIYWLAFNPTLARSLGWSPTEDALLGWRNADGDLMVWCIWWEDGLYDSKPPKFEDDVSTGWVVVGSPRALEAIARHFVSPLAQYLRIEESRLEERKTAQRTSSVKNLRREID